MPQRISLVEQSAVTAMIVRLNHPYYSETQRQNHLRSRTVIPVTVFCDPLLNVRSCPNYKIN